MADRGLSWSCSRADMFSRCRLEYFYNYIASYNGWERDADPFARTCFILKHTKNRYAWMGDMVHEALERFFTSYAGGKPMSREEITALADRTMRSQFRESKEQKYRQAPGRYNGLVEHENNLEVTDDQWKRIHENVVTCAANFFLTPVYRDDILASSLPLFRTEKLEHYFIDEIKVYAKPDVVFRREGGVDIIDWKTGSPDDSHDFQMHYYALYGIKKFTLPPEKVSARLVYLKDNLIRRVEISPESLANAEEYVRGSFREMAEMEKDLKADDIPGAKSASTCRLCRFQKICPKKITAEPCTSPADRSHQP
jgi:CRISPR/Cas system-associated exonuclease Cas4 (RecB family)